MPKRSVSLVLIAVVLPLAACQHPCVDYIVYGGHSADVLYHVKALRHELSSPPAKRRQVDQEVFLILTSLRSMADDAAEAAPTTAGRLSDVANALQNLHPSPKPIFRAALKDVSDAVNAGMPSGGCPMT